MDYKDWNILHITLYEKGLEINRALFNRSDINTTDSLAVRTLINEVFISMTLDALKPQPGSTIPTNCQNWDNMSMELMLNEILYKNISIDRSEVDNSQLKLDLFLFNKYVYLTETKFAPPTIDEIIATVEKSVLDNIEQPQPIEEDLKNIKLGLNSLHKNKKGIDNVAIGPNALNQTVSSGNIGIGKSSLATNKEGANNTAIGKQSLSGLVRGVENIALGYNAGKVIKIGQNNNQSFGSIFIGSNTRPLTDKGENEIVIGHNGIGNGSNTTTIGNDKTKETIIYGTVKSNGYKSSDGSVGIDAIFKTIDGLTITVKNGLIVSIKPTSV